jgi:FG-GAP-like repeat
MKKIKRPILALALIVSAFNLSASAQGDWYVARSTGSAFEQWQKWSTTGITNTSVRLIADVSGDGKADAVSIDINTGTWNVAKSTGKKFDKPKSWLKSFGNGMKPMLGDVNGDGKVDAVAYNPATGDWYASLSNGSKFNFSINAWITGHGIGSTNQFLADADGDRRADAIIFHPQQGTWYVAISTGSGFNKDSEWSKGHGIGSNGQYAGDVDGDGKADAIVFFNQNGKWYVAPSSGNSFGNFFQWTDGNAIGSSNQFVGDTDGDRRADPVWFYVSSGDWYSVKSQGLSNIGSSFVKWTTGHGINSAVQFLADVTGDGRADAVIGF